MKKEREEDEGGANRSWSLSHLGQLLLEQPTMEYPHHGPVC